MRKQLVLMMSLTAALAGCGQTGRLYLPESPGEVVTRPTQTPTGGDGNGTPANSPQTVDSPSAPGNPAPEVTAPEGTDPAIKKDRKDGAKTPPSDPPKKN